MTSPPASGSLMESIEEDGGALAAIEDGTFASALADAAYRQSLAVEAGEKVVVGVNRFPAETEPLEVFRVSPDVEASQVAAVRAVRERRDGAAVSAALARLRDDADNGRSVMPSTIDAVKAYATIGEIVAVLKEVHGAWQPSANF